MRKVQRTSLHDIVIKKSHRLVLGTLTVSHILQFLGLFNFYKWLRKPITIKEQCQRMIVLAIGNYVGVCYQA